jgi:hypothetical protein
MIAERALVGDMRAAKLFLQISYGWSEKDPSKLLPEKPKSESRYGTITLEEIEAEMGQLLAATHPLCVAQEAEGGPRDDIGMNSSR